MRLFRFYTMPVIALLFFASGFSALIYQVLWTRLVTSLIGGSDYSIAIIVTIFMAGLGIGSKVSGSLTSRFKNPRRALVAFGIVEIVTGLYALALPFFAPATKPLLVFFYRLALEQPLIYQLGALFTSALLLSIPVLMMGATLPLLCTAVANSLEKSRLGVPLLYGINTLGAAAGALMAGFVLIYRFGVFQTNLIAVAINVAIGITCFILYKRQSSDSRTAGASFSSQSESVTRPDHHVASRYAVWALILTFVSGFTALSSEVIWSKLLGLLVGPTTFSFSVVLFSYILCLGIGSLLAVLIIKRVNNVMPVLLLVQAVIGFSVLLISHWLGNSSVFFAKLVYEHHQSPWMLEWAKLLSVFIMFFIPVLLMGAAFPLAFRIYSLTRLKVGESIGNVYAVNTLGSVLGAFLTGFVLIPRLGMETSISLVVGIQISVAFLLAISMKQGWFSRLAIVIAMLAGIVAIRDFPKWNKLHLAEGKYHRFETMGINLSSISYGKALWSGNDLLSSRMGGTKLLYYGEGIGGFTTVMEETDILGNRRVYMANSGKVDASSHGDIYTQAMLAHLPALAHPSATNALVIGFGCGMTSGEFLYYPNIRQIDSVEISPQVIEAAAFFNPWNNNVMSSPRNRTIVQDARTQLLLGETSYDIITSEPSNPWMAGLANLFTAEYLNLVKSRLNDHGVFVQFLHSYQTDWETFSLMLRTIAHVFPNSILIRPAFFGSDYALLCFKHPDDRLLEENIIKGLPYAAQSAVLSLDAPEVVYPLIVTEDPQALAGPGPLHTDNYPLLEALAPRGLHLSGEDVDGFIMANRYLGPDSSEIMERFSRPVSQLAFARYLASGNQAPFMVMDPAATTPELWAEFVEACRHYARENPIFNYETVPRDLLADISTLQEALIQANIAGMLLSDDFSSFRLSSAHAALISIYLATGRFQEAFEARQRMALLNPHDQHLRISLAVMYLQVGDPVRALELLRVVDEVNTWEFYLLLAQTYVMVGQVDRATSLVIDQLSARFTQEMYDGYVQVLQSFGLTQPLSAFLSEWSSRASAQRSR